MIELESGRGYRKQVMLDGGKVLMRLYHADIFYFNKLAVGDGVVGFRGIDNTLQWNSTLRGWTFKFHNYQPFCPEFADGTFAYRDLFQGKDQITRFRPRNVAHVAGQLVPSIAGVTNQNAVIYPDAFGTGIDLIIAFTFRKMKKLVRIRDGFKPVVDTNFDFIMDYPEGVGVYEHNIDTGEMMPIDPLTPKTLGSRSQIYIGTDNADGKDWFTRLEPVRVWDSGVAGQGTGQKSAISPAAIANVGGFSVLRKRVTAAFLSSSVGDVFTDVTVNYAENKDTYYGTVYNQGGMPDAATMQLGGWGDAYYDYVEWDLTGSPTSEMVSAVDLYVKSDLASVNDSVSYIRRVTSSWTEAGVTSSSVPTDAGTTGQVAFPNTSTMGVQTFIHMSILALYQGWKDGTYPNYGVKFHPTVTSNNNVCRFHTSDATSSSDHPYLQLTLVDNAYTRQAKTALPSTADPLTTVYSAGEKTDVATDDGTRVGLTGAGYLIHQFKYLHTNGSDNITVTWNGQSTKAPSSAAVTLEVYNFNTPGWESLDTDNSTAATTDFTLTGTISSTPENYYDDNNYVYARVYQSV